MHSVKYTTASIFKYLTLILGALVALIPIVVVFFASLKTGTEYASTGPLTLPENWLNFSNYTKAFVDGKMLLGFKKYCHYRCDFYCGCHVDGFDDGLYFIALQI